MLCTHILLPIINELSNICSLFCHNIVNRHAVIIIISSTFDFHILIFTDDFPVDPNLIYFQEFYNITKVGYKF